MKPASLPIFSNPYPTQRQLLLLKAAVLDGPHALDAWNVWREGWDPDEYLDHGSFRLLPLLYRKLVSERVTDPEILKLKGIYRQSWVKNNRLFHQACGLLEWFHAQNIPVMVLKGIPMSILYYRDHGARPMADLDVLIPVSLAPKCIELLQAAGWQPEYGQYIQYNLKHGRSMMFRNSEGFEADIHWYPLFESLGAGNDQAFWEDAEPMELHHTTTRAPCPSDMLLHILVHGLKWNPEPPIRWIPDALAVIRSPRMASDWPRFLERVKQYKVVLTVREACNYLIRHFDAPIPGEVIDALNGCYIGTAQKVIHQFDQKNPACITHGFRDRMHVLLVTYLRQSPKKGLINQIPGFLWYLIFRTKGKSRTSILFYYFKRKVKEKRKHNISAPDHFIS